MTLPATDAILDFLDCVEDYLGDGCKHSRPPRPLPSQAAVAPARAATPVVGAAGQVIAPAVAAAVAPASSDSLAHISTDVAACAACPLAATRTYTVPGEGVSAPLVMVIGEGPGKDEDLSGRPFVGNAGQLLDKMLIAIDLARNKNCYIANVVKCRPPQNRDPAEKEIAACAAFLQRQIALLKPKAILVLGRVAAQALLQTTEPLGKLRGHFVDYAGTPLLITYHPSALLRDETLKRPAWDDLKLLKKFLTE